MEKAKKNHDKVLRDLMLFKQPTRNLTLITEAIVVRPKLAKCFLARAQLYRILGRNQLAFCDYNAVLRLDKNLMRAYAL